MKAENPSNNIQKRLRIKPKDIEIFYLVFEYVFLTGEQIARHFGQPWKADGGLAKRLKKLSDLQYLTRPSKAPLVHTYTLGDEGAEFVKRDFESVMPKTGSWSAKGERLRPSTFGEHEIALRNFMMELECSSREGDFRLIKRTDILAKNNLGTKKKSSAWPTEIYWGEQYHEVTINPDWIFGIEDLKTGKQQFYFLEIDMGTEPLTRSMYDRNQTILRKVLSYANTYEMKLAQEYFGLPKFKVLFLTTGERRMNNMIELYQEYAKALAPPRVFLFGTQANYTKLLDGNKKQRELTNRD